MFSPEWMANASRRHYTVRCSLDRHPSSAAKIDRCASWGLATVALSSLNLLLEWRANASRRHYTVRCSLDRHPSSAAKIDRCASWCLATVALSSLNLLLDGGTETMQFTFQVQRSILV